MNAGGPDRAEVSSCLRQGQDLVIHQGSCEGQRLANVFVLKLGVFAFEFSSPRALGAPKGVGHVCMAPHSAGQHWL